VENPEVNLTDVGIITVACGPAKYIAWAKALARSLALHDPARPRAIVTDSADPSLRRLFDHVIRPLPGRGVFQHKLLLGEYSPFARTLFLDADSVVVQPLQEAIHTLSCQSFALVGEQRTSGSWYFDIGEMTQRLNRPWIPKFNSGLIYFDKSGTTVFARALKLMENYAQLGFQDPYGRINDEPCIAVAMAELNIPTIHDDGSIMRTPIGMKGKLQIDPIRGICQFNSDGSIVSPAVVHFVSRTKHRDYARVRFCLALHALGLREKLGLWNKVVVKPASLLGSWGWSAMQKSSLISA
jgi:hypothetical protein